MSRIGVLALQGGYAAHLRALTDLGHTAVQIRRPAEFTDLDGLILPGGESTTHLKLINAFDLAEPLDTFMHSGKPVFATCAGLILAAKKVSGPNQPSFGWLDIDVVRNGWGRQVHSFEALADRPLLGDEIPISMMFIRAPRIERIGPNVTCLATFQGEPVMVQQGSIFGAAFHPELTTDRRVHARIFGA